MLDEESDASLLRLLTCFLMSAPQAIIQLVFLLTQHMTASRLTLSMRNTLSGIAQILCDLTLLIFIITNC